MKRLNLILHSFLDTLAAMGREIRVMPKGYIVVMFVIALATCIGVLWAQGQIR